MREGVVCAGLSCLDLYLLNTEPLVTRESLSLVESVEFVAGGATSNVGRSLAELSVRVELMTLIGQDINGDTLLRQWRDAGIGTNFVRRTDAAPTALSTLPIYKDGKRGVYFCSGTNTMMDADALLGPERSGLRDLEGFQIFHFGYPHLLPLLQGEALGEMLEEVAGTGIAVSLDTSSFLDDERHRAILAPAFPHVGLFHANVEEAAAIAGRSIEFIEQARALGPDAVIEDVVTPDDVISIGDELLSLGPPLVAISLGPNGAYVASRGADALTEGLGPVAPDDLHSWEHRRIFAPAFRAGPETNATGAGDAFVAGLLAGLCGARDLDPSGIVRLAHAAALQRVDAQRPQAELGELAAHLDELQNLAPPNPALAAWAS